MKQVVQDLRGGKTVLVEVPRSATRQGFLCIQSRASLISAGTEKMLVEFGKASLLAKARSQPDKVKQVLDKVRTDGLMPTLETVFRRLDEPLPLGYCNAGIVLDVGPGIEGFKPGDRVVSNGPHAEFVCVPKNLCAKIPDSVTDEQASFTVLASIGLQGIRLIRPTFGETIVVMGLGLIGLIAAQILRANGCHVIGTDVDADRLKLAESFGIQTVDVAAGNDPAVAAMAATHGIGVDGVIVTAATKSDELIHQAADMCRKRGRIVLVGVVGLHMRRADFYEKELSFQVSCSYGPGRYDESYEQIGQDYPIGFVRWTEQRNFVAVLNALAERTLNVDALISHRFDFHDAPAAYEQISAGRTLGIILRYPADVRQDATITIAAPAEKASVGKVVAGLIGAGNFAKMTLAPALVKTNARLAWIADINGAAAAHLARKHKIEKATTDRTKILEDGDTNAVFIAVGHNLHARFVCEGLAARKHVFVEKPLAMNVDEIHEVLDAAAAFPKQQVMVGFNRRFAPHIVKMKELLAGRSEPLAMTMTVNAGIIPPRHWVHDPVRGGGRIIGEACHFLDLLAFLAESKIASVAAAAMGPGVAISEDKMTISLSFEDGSIGTVNYFANGAKSYPKEQLEVFSEGRVLRLDNFRELRGYGFSSFKRFRSRRQDKGHAAELAAFVHSVAEGGAPVIPMDQLINTTLASFAAVIAARETRTVVLKDQYGNAWLATPRGEAVGDGGKAPFVSARS